jgi:hypothetical protein
MLIERSNRNFGDFPQQIARYCHIMTVLCINSEKYLNDFFYFGVKFESILNFTDIEPKSHKSFILHNGVDIFIQFFRLCGEVDFSCFGRESGVVEFPRFALFNSKETLAFSSPLTIIDMWWVPGKCLRVD